MPSLCLHHAAQGTHTWGSGGGANGMHMTPAAGQVRTGPEHGARAVVVCTVSGEAHIEADHEVCHPATTQCNSMISQLSTEFEQTAK